MQTPIHEIPFNKKNTPGFITFVEALRQWSDSNSEKEIRCEKSWQQWYLLNMWLKDDYQVKINHPLCAKCSLPLSANGGCSACVKGTWLFN